MQGGFQQSQMMGDPIGRLPTDARASYAANDDALVNHLFGATDKVNTKAVASYIKGPLIVAAIVGIMCMPQVNELIEKMVPSARESIYTNIMVKMVLAAIIYYVLHNWALSRA